jgi:hypothetical protein
MRKKVVQIIKILGIGLNEIIVDFEVNGIFVNSIECSSDGKKVYLHVFSEDLDIEIDFDELTMANRRFVLNKLSQIIYN